MEKWGFKNTKILDGGLAKWFAFYHPIDSGATSAKATPIVLPELKCDTSSLVDYEFVKKNVGNPDVQFVDARFQGSYDGHAKDNVPGCR